MPVHEGAAWIEATLDSLVAEPAGNLEIIVIDSTPTSATAAIVERFDHRIPLRLLQRRDLTPWQTKTNLGVELATADHVCILHQDDLWLPGRVEAARRWLDGSPEVALHLAPTAIIDRYGHRVGRWNCPLPADKVLGAQFLLERLLVQNFVSVPAPIFRRTAWLVCGGMDEKLWYTADWDIWAKLASTGPVVYHDEVTTAFRVHGSSLTVTGSRDVSEFRSQMQIVMERHLPQLPASSRRLVEPTARASISVNVSLAAASGGDLKALVRAARVVFSLGPGGMRRYLRDSRLWERVICRLRAKLTGAF
ncbi:glycosyltransferase [Mesorhizobium sp. M2A.F.Ca.ET.037.01.1.1]|nr:glycosyltransferase [Mesorhizobium sp. M2A.F.Ca.ET.046.03.2.1]RUX19225.1 glycosyltransferase [Mesorhizobium sp. M2A.F.Ca.ET.037.01.1.1]RVC66676.1 glycosyltransferase [Mesorhizobium sp. M00.F.Ca.ET.038.03.1.1]RWA94123.1 MAG: glycosyltransferase [Mesorhizobium sp.]RWX71323.1 glycosyltransferase [Mesorhizobium sp. M2A.F.Ca.ET.039.01.1.1]